jgi:membrane-bound lytic murein transglycosylase D
MRNAALLVALLFSAMDLSMAQVGANDQNSDLFPRPSELADPIEFWTRVYTEIDTSSGFIHDNRHLGVVYETLRFDANISSRQRRRLTDRATAHYRDILNKLADSSGAALTTDEARVRAQWPANTARGEYREAARRLRFQLGQSDRFRAGLERSGRWRDYITDVLDSRGLPTELAVLPHVESSFDPTAYSKVGAAGMWQFTRSTGLRYMRIDHIVDERRDPFLATEAAAKLLGDNYSVIESWPLALTAYNHGLAGMRRAVRAHETKDMGVIVEKYSSRTFGFASRNFYAAFIAALDVDQNAERYFDNLEMDSPARHAVFTPTDYVDAAPLAAALDISIAELKRLNPALTDSVWAGEKFVPRGFALRIPATLAESASAQFAGIPGTERFAEQRPDLQHRVRRGETLSGIADRYRVSLAALIRANGLSNRNFIREGQQLNLPASSGTQVATVAAAPAREIATPGGEYVVRRGDSIDRIARRLGVDQAALLSVNQISNRNRIYPGQVLNVPGGPAESSLDLLAAAVADQELPPQVVPLTLATAAPPGTEQPTDTASSAPSLLEQTITAAAEPMETPDDAFANALASELTIDTNAPALGRDEANAAVFADESSVDIDANVLASSQASLAADPSDYSVAADQSIEVQAMETLGHYADWLQVRTQRLRDLNGLAFSQAVVYGERIRLDFSSIDAARFEARRQAYQEQRQESFFSSYQISEIVDHVVRSGESLWLLALRTYDVPVWLLRQYNPDINLDQVRPGTVVKFPRLREIGPELASVLTEIDIG